MDYATTLQMLDNNETFPGEPEGETNTYCHRCREFVLDDATVCWWCDSTDIRKVDAPVDPQAESWGR